MPMVTSTLDKCFSDFLQRRSMKHFSTGVQSVYFSIVAEFWLRGFPETVTLTVRDLADAAGLSVGQTHTAKNILKNNKLIDFRNEQGRSVFWLCHTENGAEHRPNTDRTQTEHGLNTDRTRTEQEGLITCAKNAELSAAAPLPLPPTPPIPNPKNNIHQSNQSSQSNPSLAELSLAEQKDVLDVWEEMTGAPLKSPAEKFILRSMDDTHGREIIKVALEEHVQSKGKTFKYFEACLRSLVARLKGGEKDVRVDRNGRYAGMVSGTAPRFERPDGESNSGKGRYDDEEPDYTWLYEDIEKLDKGTAELRQLAGASAARTERIH